MTSCNRNKDVAENVHALPEIYPDYRGVTVPWNIAPLNFCMTDDEYSSMEVRVKGALKGEMICEGDYADFDIDEWHRLLNDNKGGKVNVSVSAEKNGKWMTSVLHHSISPVSSILWSTLRGMPASALRLPMPSR